MVQLVPEPLPALSTSSHDQELDVSLDEIASQGGAATQHDAERESGSTELELSDEGGLETPDTHNICIDSFSIDCHKMCLKRPFE